MTDGAAYEMGRADERLLNKSALAGLRAERDAADGAYRAWKRKAELLEVDLQALRDDVILCERKRAMTERQLDNYYHAFNDRGLKLQELRDALTDCCISARHHEECAICGCYFASVKDKEACLSTCPGFRGRAVLAAQIAEEDNRRRAAGEEAAS